MLETFFNPTSIALIGATDDATKIGGKIVLTLLREKYAGRFYPVNRTSNRIAGHAAYPSIGAVPDTSCRIFESCLPPFSNSVFTRSREAVISCANPLSWFAICAVSCTTVPLPVVPVSAPDWRS